MLIFDNLVTERDRPLRGEQVPEAPLLCAIGLARCCIAAECVDRFALVSPLQAAIGAVNRGPVANLMRLLRGGDWRPFPGARAHAYRTARRIALENIKRVTIVIAELEDTILQHQADLGGHRLVLQTLREHRTDERQAQGRDAQYRQFARRSAARLHRYAP